MNEEKPPKGHAQILFDDQIEPQTSYQADLLSTLDNLFQFLLLVLTAKGEELPESIKVEDYFYIENTSGLIAEAQMDTLEFHTWGSRVDELEKPDMMVFDLDPDEGMDLSSEKRGRGIHGKIFSGIISSLNEQART